MWNANIISSKHDYANTFWPTNPIAGLIQRNFSTDQKVIFEDVPLSVVYDIRGVGGSKSNDSGSLERKP